MGKLLEIFSIDLLTKSINLITFCVLSFFKKSGQDIEAT